MSDSAYDDWIEKQGPYNTIAGDYHDDDAQYIDQLFETSSAPADESNTARVVRVIQEKPVVCNRLLTGTHILTAANLGLPFQVLPADKNRKHLTLLVVPGGVSDYVLFADDPNKLTYDTSSASNPNPTSARLWGGYPLSLDDYTGPMYISLGKTAGTTYFTYYAITI